MLITGATGFIGNRLVEMLGQSPNTEVRALVHQFMNASRIARFPIKMFGGSLLDRDAVAAAMNDVHVVFHLAYGTHGTAEERRRTTIEGTRIVCEEALRVGVQRFVYTSTFSVYGQEVEGDLTKSAVRQMSGDAYADSKLETETLVLEFCRTKGLPAVILQPTIVYGPFSFWSRWPIEQLTKGIVVLPDQGHGFCNAVYVDDVVNALLLAGSVRGQEGEVFLISGEKPSDWNTYYRAYASMLSDVRLEFEPSKQIARVLHQSRDRPASVSRLLGRAFRSPRVRRELRALPLVDATYRVVRRITPQSIWEKKMSSHEADSGTRPETAQRRLYPLPSHIALFQSGAHVQIDKAVEKLGYRPQTDLRTGLGKTELWARWFGLVA